MSYIRIVNNGEIDINALTLLGASSKEGDASKIGFFGSGNKYAMATLIREDFEVRIFSGITEFRIEKEAVAFRGQDFDRLVINGVATSITTRTGPAWEPWMALREFISNAIDEGDASWDEVESIPEEENAPGKTVIYVELKGSLVDIWANFTDLMCFAVPSVHDIKLEYQYSTMGNVRMLPHIEGNEVRFYRKGICCFVEKDYTKALFNYDFSQIPINESRLLDSSWRAYERIASAFALTENADLIKSYLAVALDTGYAESQFRWSTSYVSEVLSRAWEIILLALNKTICGESVFGFIPNDTKHMYYQVPDALADKIRRDLPKVPVFGDSNERYAEATPSEACIAKTNEALAELEELGVPVTSPITYVKFFDDGVIARVIGGKKILLTVDPHEEDLVAVLLEEHIHITKNMRDYSRELQTYLLDMYVTGLREIHSLKTIPHKNEDKLSSVKMIFDAQIQALQSSMAAILS